MGGQDAMNASPAPGQGPGPEPGPAHGPATGWAGRLRGVSRARLAGIAGAVTALVVVLAVIGATVGSGRPTSHRLSQARTFTLSALGHPGQHISLAAFAGRPVIVNFFASWCTPCQRETPLIAHYYRATHGHPQVIGIDVNDSAAAAQAFIHKAGVRYPIAVDPPPLKTALSYGLPGLPATFFLNARHQIVKRVFGRLTPAALATGSKLMAQRGK
jgi:cytochrome c biogenesis protein CcmG, thiol:disulfide interchange protein DsbE